jgi:DNA-binding XRE family transcriptional regulator
MLVRVRELRLARGLSQAQLAEVSGLSVRTIQRIERGANPGLESMRLLAAALGVELEELGATHHGPPRRMSFAEAVPHCLRHFADFDGVAGRDEFWWFTLAVVIVAAIAGSIHPALSAPALMLALLPLLAAATRRLRSAGHSPWWLLMLFAPVGGLVVVGTLLAMPDVTSQEGAPSPG